MLAPVRKQEMKMIYVFRMNYHFLNVKKEKEKKTRVGQVILSIYMSFR